MSRLTYQTRRWNRKEYAQLLHVGILHEDDPIELIDGQLVVGEPQDPPRATATQIVADALRTAFGHGWHVRSGLPVALDDESEPEPDVSVVPGHPRDYLADHPAHPALVVEASFSRLAFDRGVKGGLYARAGIAEYWIVNLVDHVLLVHREPVRAATARYGWRYRRVSSHKPPAVVTPLAAPSARMAIADLLP